MIGNGHTTPATPEDDKQAQTIISNVEEFIYDQEVQSELVAKMGEGDPSTVIGGITGQLVHMQMVVAEGSGVQLSRDILIAVAAEIVNALIEIAMQAGIIQEDQQLEQLQGDALIAAVDAYMQLGDHKVNGEAASNLTQEVMGGQMDSPEAQQGLVNNMGGGIPPEAQGDIPMEGEGIPPEEQVPMGTQGLIGGAV